MNRARALTLTYRASAFGVIGILIAFSSMPRLEAAPPKPYRLVRDPSIQKLEAHTLAQLTKRSQSRSWCWNYKRSERGFTRQMNAARSLLNRSRLRLDPQLSKVARVHTRDMVKRNSLHHSPSDQLKRRVKRWVVLGENVGVGAEVNTLHSAFMQSPAHRANIVFSQFRHVGVGVAQTESRMWVTVIFEARRNPGTSLAMPSC
jgi:uncharacterized protein YkwD